MLIIYVDFPTLRGTPPPNVEQPSSLQVHDRSDGHEKNGRGVRSTRGRVGTWIVRLRTTETWLKRQKSGETQWPCRSRYTLGLVPCRTFKRGLGKGRTTSDKGIPRMGVRVCPWICGRQRGPERRVKIKWKTLGSRRERMKTPLRFHSKIHY